MSIPAFSRTALVFASALALTCVSGPAFARRGGSSHGGGGSHGGKAFHGGGHSSFKGSGHFSGGSRGGSRFSSARIEGRTESGRKNSGRLNAGSFGRAEGFSSRPSSSFSRSSNFGRGDFGRGGFSASNASRNFSGFGGAQAQTREAGSRESRQSTTAWRSFGNSNGHSLLASARGSENAMGGGSRSFGSFNRPSGMEPSHSFGNSARNEGQWHSFGNSRSAPFTGSSRGFSSFAATANSGANPRASGSGFGTRHFSADLLPSSRYSSFSSFSRPGTRFGGSGFGAFGFEGSTLASSSFSGSGFSNSGIGSGVSLFPGLFSGLLGLGTTIFGGHAFLAVDAISLAVRLFESALSSSDSGQGGSGSYYGDAGFGQSGFAGNFGFGAYPAWSACGPGGPLWAPPPAPGAYCGPYAYRPFGSSAFGYLGDPAIGFRY